MQSGASVRSIECIMVVVCTVTLLGLGVPCCVYMLCFWLGNSRCTRKFVLASWCTALH